MRTWMAIGTVIVLIAAGATAKDFVNEDFEGTFPPAGWTVRYEGTGNASWTQGTGGPGGRYAYGSVSSWQDGLVKATLMSPEFNVKPNTRVYYRFDYSHFDHGHGTGGAEFYITYVQPQAGNLIYVNLADTSEEWVERAGNAVNDLDGRLKACWRVWANDAWRYHFSFLMVDDVIISEERRFPAVEPVSLGRVKTLFR